MGKDLKEYDGKRLKTLDGVTVLQITPLGRDICVVSHSVWEGKHGLDIRRYYWDATNEEWAPTGKGIRMPEDSAQSFLDQIKQLESDIIHG